MFWLNTLQCKEQSDPCSVCDVCCTAVLCLHWVKPNTHILYYIDIIFIILLFLVAFPSADIPAYPAVPWSDFYTQGAPFSNQLHPQMPFSSVAGGQCFTEPYLLQVPNRTVLEFIPQTGRQKGVTPPEQSSYQSYQTEAELAALAEKEYLERSSKKGETGW